jgi:lysozyme family protein
MTNNFVDCFTFTLIEEGGLVDDPRDPGGITCHGITVADLKRLAGSATANDVRALEKANPDVLMGIYYGLYWVPVSGDALPGGIDLMVFDHAVLAGVSDSAKILQRALGVPVDGVIGPNTVNAAKSFGSQLELLSMLSAAQAQDLKAKPVSAIYAKGWDDRLARRTRKAGQILSWPSLGHGV